MVKNNTDVEISKTTMVSWRTYWAAAEKYKCSYIKIHKYIQVRAIQKAGVWNYFDKRNKTRRKVELGIVFFPKENIELVLP